MAKTTDELKNDYEQITVEEIWIGPEDLFDNNLFADDLLSALKRLKKHGVDLSRYAVDSDGCSVTLTNEH